MKEEQERLARGIEGKQTEYERLIEQHERQRDKQEAVGEAREAEGRAYRLAVGVEGKTGGTGEARRRRG